MITQAHLPVHAAPEFCGIYALGKAYVRSTLSRRSVRSALFETVANVRLTYCMTGALCRPLKKGLCVFLLLLRTPSSILQAIDGVRSHSEHHFPAPSSKLCQISYTTKGALFITA